MKMIMPLVVVLCLGEVVAHAQTKFNDNKTKEERQIETNFIQKNDRIEKEYLNTTANLMKKKMHPDMLTLLKGHAFQKRDFDKQANEDLFEFQMQQLQEVQELQEKIDAEKLLNQQGRR